MKQVIRRHVAVLLVIFLVSTVWAQQAKYVFYFIGDGMGVNQVNGAEMYLAEQEGRIGVKPLLFTTFPAGTMATTFSATNSVTDSSAAGTALATGEKTYNGAVSMDDDKNVLSTVAERAKKAGRKVGIATSVSVDHATPAAFYAHQPNRSRYYEIALDLPKAGFDFYAGSGFLKPTTTADKKEAPNVFPIIEEVEDNIVQHYPRQIVMVKELIEKLEQDIALYEQNAATSKDKFHMQVGSGVYDTRKDAGNAIIKFFQTDADGTAKIGTYLGFSMNIAFDSFNRKFVLRLKGAMNHPVEIGPDPVGNIIRLNNVLKTMPDKLAEAKDRLETLTNQLESAKIEVTKPFQQEEELAEKLKRLAELNALLNMDEKGTDALILEDDEQPAIVNSDMAVTPITSVKTKPMLKKKVVGLCL